MNDEKNTVLYQDYMARVNTAQDYINTHITKNLTLGEIAAAANFSEYHFHRIFSSIVHESLYKYIRRLRLEKAAALLMYTHNKSITDIAMDCGFSDSAVFARAFKNHYGISASSYKSVKSKNCKVSPGPLRYNDIKAKGHKEAVFRDITYSIDIQENQEMTAVYIRYTGPYRNNKQVYRSQIQRLMKWAAARDLLKRKEFKLFSIYHDHPEITEDDKQRTSICLAVPHDTQVQGIVGKMKIQAGKYAVGHFELSEHQFEDAWNIMFGVWLPGSGYQAKDVPGFEVYKNNPEHHPLKKSLVDIYLPIKAF